MRDEKNRLTVDKLFILGAGASFSASRAPRPISPQSVAPLDAELGRRIAGLSYQRPLWVSRAVQSLNDTWYGREPFGSEGLERSIIRQLGWMDCYDALHPRGKRKKATDQGRFIDAVAHLVTFALSKVKEGTNEPYGRLVDHLFGSGSIEGNRSRIITFNYDSLLDAHLLKRFSPQQVYFDKINAEARSRRSSIHPDPLLLKLHGSVNWRCSSDELRGIIAAAPGESVPPVSSVTVEDDRVPSTEDRQSPLIIAPLAAKPITAVKLFEWLWIRAAEYTESASEIVVVGYSLPEADMLAKSLFERSRLKNVTRITVVDPTAAVLERWRSVLKPARPARWEWAQDFSEYVATLPAATS